MTIVTEHDQLRRVIVGVDTHKDVHVAAAIDDRGALLDVREFVASPAGYLELIAWSEAATAGLGVDV